MRTKKSDKRQETDPLSDLLIAVALSPRFILLKHLKMKNLSFDGVSFAGAFEELTLGDVVALSKDEILSLPRMTEECQRALIGLLRTYSEPSDEASPSGMIIPLRPSTESDLAPIRRGEAEAKLQEFLKVLKKAPPEKLKNSTLRAYWDKSFPSAPFEEVLTFQQLLELGYENLTRKRTLHTDKILAIVDAGERFLSNVTPKTQGDRNAGFRAEVSFVLKKISDKNKLPKDLLLLGEPVEGRLKVLLKTGEVYSASSGEATIGVFVLDTKAKVISLLAISKDYRRQGYGKALIAEAIRKVKEKKWKRIIFTLRNSAVDGASFLQREGFRIASVEKDYYTKKYKNEELIEGGVLARDLLSFEQG